MSFLSQPITLQSLFGPKRTIGDIDVQVIVSESSTDTLTVTKQPVQQGASIADHAYKEPTSLGMSLLFTDNSLSSILSPFSQNGLAKIYQELLDLQSLREPFTVTTPKRIYETMLMTSLSQTTDKRTENVLSVSVSFQQVIIVPVTTSFVIRANQLSPGKTGATQPGGKKSALLSGKQAVGALFK